MKARLQAPFALTPDHRRTATKIARRDPATTARILAWASTNRLSVDEMRDKWGRGLHGRISAKKSQALCSYLPVLKFEAWAVRNRDMGAQQLQIVARDLKYCAPLLRRILAEVDRLNCLDGVSPRTP